MRLFVLIILVIITYATSQQTTNKSRGRPRLGSPHASERRDGSNIKITSVIATNPIPQHRQRSLNSFGNNQFQSPEFAGNVRITRVSSNQNDFGQKLMINTNHQLSASGLQAFRNNPYQINSLTDFINPLSPKRQAGVSADLNRNEIAQHVINSIGNQPMFPNNFAQQTHTPINAIATPTQSSFNFAQFGNTVAPQMPNFQPLPDNARIGVSGATATTPMGQNTFAPNNNAANTQTNFGNTQHVPMFLPPPFPQNAVITGVTAMPQSGQQPGFQPPQLPSGARNTGGNAMASFPINGATQSVQGGFQPPQLPSGARVTGVNAMAGFPTNVDTQSVQGGFQPPQLPSGASNTGGIAMANAPQNAGTQSVFPSASLLPVLPKVLPFTSGPGARNEVFLNDAWSNFKRQFNKVYRSPQEEFFRREIFIENTNKISKLNEDYGAGKTTFVNQINGYGDVLHHQFDEMLNGYNRTNSRTNQDNIIPTPKATFFIPSSNIRIPDEIDWREMGAVTPVKSQGLCGACYAFSAAGALEGQNFRKTGALIELSPQNLVDCTKPYGNDGCLGGLMNPAFQYVKDNPGIDTESTYPFESMDGSSCRYKPEGFGADDTGFVEIPQGDEQALKIAVATVGPISIAMDASVNTLQFYSNGVYFDDKCKSATEDMNHAALVVGYGVEPDGKEYWMIKNSYGAQWGIGGYIKIARNANNHCGIATLASYPLV